MFILWNTVEGIFIWTEVANGSCLFHPDFFNKLPVFGSNSSFFRSSRQEVFLILRKTHRKAPTPESATLQSSEEQIKLACFCHASHLHLHSLHLFFFHLNACRLQNLSTRVEQIHKYSSKSFASCNVSSKALLSLS